MDLCVDEGRTGCTDGTSCGGDGWCHDNVCFPIECGNRLADADEVCDDGNNDSGDGCSADCSSLETCGNAIVDTASGEICDNSIAGLSGDGCTSTCTPESLAWRDATPGLVQGRRGHAMSTFRDRVLVFGGLIQSKPVNDTWEWDGSLWRQHMPARTPPGRAFHAMAYDSLRDRVVLYGGAAGDALGDTWEFDGETWKQLTPATSPGARYAHAMTYDSARARVVLFGGRATSGALVLTDTWEWDGMTWTQKTTAASPPFPSSRPTLAYDPIAMRAVYHVALIGPQTWQYDGTNWSLRSCSGTCTEADVQLDGVVFDPTRGKLVGFNYEAIAGGSETWIWEPTGWTELTQATQIPLWTQSAIAYHPERQGVVVFGGIDQASADVDELYLLDGPAWALQPSLSASPPARFGHAVAFHALRGGVLLFSGRTNVGMLADTWLWSKHGWSDLSSPGSPTARAYHALAYDSARDRIVLFGGMTGIVGDPSPPRDDTWEWDGMTWAQGSPAQRPPRRRLAAMAYDQARGRTILFGGDENGTHVPSSFVYGDTWSWDGTTWTQMSTATSPPARQGAGMVYDAAREVITLFGGSSRDGLLTPTPLGDTWEWDGATWTDKTPANSLPTPRHQPAMYYDAVRRRVVMTFGRGSATAFDETWEWDGTTWERLQPGPSPSPRAVIAYDALGQRAIAFGGISSPAVGDTWTLEYTALGVGREVCVDATFDDDSDGLFGCADPDCFGRCSPLCLPGAACGVGPRCGDGTCTTLETEALCPADCMQ